MAVLMSNNSLLLRTSLALYRLAYANGSGLPAYPLDCHPGLKCKWVAFVFLESMLKEASYSLGDKVHTLWGGPVYSEKEE